MSYDLYLLDLPPGANIEDVLERYEDIAPSPERADTYRAIAAEHDGFEINPGATQMFHEEFGATIDLGETGATVNVAY